MGCLVVSRSGQSQSQSQSQWSVVKLFATDYGIKGIFFRSGIISFYKLNTATEHFHFCHAVKHLNHKEHKECTRYTRKYSVAVAVFSITYSTFHIQQSIPLILQSVAKNQRLVCHADVRKHHIILITLLIQHRVCHAVKLLYATSRSSN